MYIDGIELTAGSSVENLSIDSGISFPSSPSNGELFYLTTGTVGLYIYTASGWQLVNESTKTAGEMLNSGRLVTTTTYTVTADATFLRLSDDFVITPSSTTSKLHVTTQTYGSTERDAHDRANGQFRMSYQDNIGTWTAYPHGFGMIYGLCGPITNALFRQRSTVMLNGVFDQTQLDASGDWRFRIEGLKAGTQAGDTTGYETEVMFFEIEP